MKCSYCFSRYYESETHRGTCVNCGAPESLTDSRTMTLTFDIYQNPYYMDEAGNFVRMADEKEVENILIHNRDAVGLARWNALRKSGASLESLELTIDTETGKKIVIENSASFIASILNATRN